MEKTKVLFIDDDTVLGNIVTVALNEEGFETYYQTSLVAARSVVEELRPNILVLDVEIGRQDGIEIAPELRRTLPDIPILFVSSHTDSHHVSQALEAGGIAYLKKPFEIEELIAYIRRHVTATPAAEYQLGKYLFNPSEQTLSKEGELVQKLTSSESKLLALLAREMGHVVSREIIIQELWSDGNANEQSLNNFVAKLRKYLSEEPSIELTTLHKAGYKLEKISH